MTGTPVKLRDGTWGARVQGAAKVGDTVTITTRSGKSWTATVRRVLWTGSGVSIVATRAADRGAADRRRSGLGSGHGWASQVAGYSDYCTGRPGCGCFDCAS
jgi:hypothetical protein